MLTIFAAIRDRFAAGFCIFAAQSDVIKEFLVRDAFVRMNHHAMFVQLSPEPLL